jgi:pimeloyl-ACP methyl ester carboxylesterase
MTAVRVNSIACVNPTGLHRMAYYEWGDPDNDSLLLCVHGLTRTGRDFDAVAERLSKRFRVVCPDVVGRGLSDWLTQPLGYAVPQYAADMVTLIARLQPKTLHWVGTSMGGLIALSYAALVAQSQQRFRPTPPARLSASIADPVVPISRLVLNDVGPKVEAVSLARIGQYLAQDLQFESFEASVQYMKQTAASFGPHTDEQWATLTRHYFVPRDGRWVKHYDPGIAMAFAGVSQELMTQGEQMLWGAYGCVNAPTLILHGKQSDLLTTDTVQKMVQINPQARAVVFDGVGHAPSLIVENQIQTVVDFIEAK